MARLIALTLVTCLIGVSVSAHAQTGRGLSHVLAGSSRPSLGRPGGYQSYRRRSACAAHARARVGVCVSAL